MHTEVTMPRMGQSMEEGIVLRWLKSVGDSVTRGEPLVEIETDKATVDIQSFVTGILVEILVEEGRTVNIGAPIAVIDENVIAGSPVPVSVSPTASSTNTPSRTNASRPNASPLAKRLAQESGIDLLLIQGTGPGGRIGKDDIRQWLSANRKPVDVATPIQATPTAFRLVSANRIPLSKIKQVTARRMSASKASAPHFYVSMDIEMSRALALRESLKKRGHSVSVNDLILKAAALALVQFPNLNATFAGDAIERHTNINLAVAVAIGENESEGLITPVILSCQDRSLVEIANGTKEAIERARSGRLNTGDLDGGTFTVSNLGMYGVKDFAAIVNPPHAAILAVGAVRRMPIFDEQDRVIPAQILTATLSADHRITDGAEAARFLGALKGHLEDAFSLVSVF